MLEAALAAVAAAASRLLQSERPPPFRRGKAGEEREVESVRLCWCPAGRFIMGSPASEPERRPGEDQIAVTLSRGFWTAKYETTQGQWRGVVGELPGPLTEQLPAGDDLRLAASTLRRAYFVLEFITAFMAEFSPNHANARELAMFATGLRMITSIVMIVQCFVVRSILEDHLAGPDDAVSYPSVVERVKLSGLMTFFFHIFYLQWAINRYIVGGRQEASNVATT